MNGLEINKSHDSSVLETPSSLREKRRISRHHLDHSLAKLREIAKKGSSFYSTPSSPVEEDFDVEPLPMSQRIVVRSMTMLSPQQCVDFHNLLKKDSAGARKVLKYSRHPRHGWYTLNRCALRAECEE